MNKEVYLIEVINQMPRLLGLLDRNISSKTFGCFDRNYWQYKIIDFPCARCQEATLTLALLYKLNHKDNPYYCKENILKWACAGIDFWVKIQEKNGSFNEWYPHENSFVATAFSSYAISETILLLKNKIDSDLKDKAIIALKKAGYWLFKKEEKRALNQQSGDLVALYNIYLLTKDGTIKKNITKKIKFIKENQTKEGWFFEYNGPDIGYLSLTIDYLSKYYQKTKDRKVLPIIDKAIDFISYFIYPNFTSGSEYCSRNTEYLIPHGFEIMGERNKLAAGISYAIRESLKNKNTVSPFSLDDRYLLYVSHTWLQSYIDSCNIKDYYLRNSKKFTKNFSQAYIFIFNDYNHFVVINYGKGGSYKLYINGKTYYDGGIYIETAKAKMSSGTLTDKNIIKIYKNKLTIEGHFWITKDNLMTPKKNIMIRLFQSTMGRSEHVGGYLKEKLRDKLITKSKRANFIYRREIILKEKNVQVTDFIKGKNIKRVVVGSKSPNIFVPSSRYFQLDELENYSFDLKLNKDIIKMTRIYNNKGQVRLIL